MKTIAIHLRKGGSGKTDVMLEVLDNLESLVAAAGEADGSNPETPAWRPIA